MDYVEAAKGAISLAGKHTMPTTGTISGISLHDAIACRDRGRTEDAYNRALTSLRYSVGVWHRDYVKALGLVPRK